MLVGWLVVSLMVVYDDDDDDDAQCNKTRRAATNKNGHYVDDADPRDGVQLFSIQSEELLLPFRVTLRKSFDKARTFRFRRKRENVASRRRVQLSRAFSGQQRTSALNLSRSTNLDDVLEALGGASKQRQLVVLQRAHARTGERRRDFEREARVVGCCGAARLSTRTKS